MYELTCRIWSSLYTYNIVINWVYRKKWVILRRPPPRNTIMNTIDEIELCD